MTRVLKKLLISTDFIGKLPRMNFNQFVAKAWSDHALHPGEVAARVKAFAEQEQNQDHIPELASLITHLYGEHLGQWQDGIAQLERLQMLADSAETRNAIYRSLSALRLAAGFSDNVDDLLASDQIRVLCLASSALLGQGQFARAAAYFADALVIAGDDSLPGGDPAFRALAVAANNIAVDLNGRATRTPAETDLMLRAARAALKFWLIAGDWNHHQRAHYRLAKCLLAAGQPVEALEEGLSCLAMCKANGATAYDLFWANEVVASVIHATKPSAFVDYLKAMRDCFEKLDERDRAFCEPRMTELENAIA